MKDNIRSEISQRVEYMKENKDSLVLDGDTHPSDLNTISEDIQKKLANNPDYYQGRPISTEELIKEMDMAEVDMCISWQNPAVTVYEGFTQESYQVNFQNLLKANHHIYQSGKDYPKRIIPCGWTDPKALGVELAKRMATICVEEYGFPIVKMNPGQNEYPLDSPEVLEVVSHIVSLGAVPTFHFGGDTEFTTAEALARIAEMHPNSRIVAVHMGGGGSHYVYGDETYIKTRELGLKYPNLFFILSAIRDCHIESNLISYQLAGRPFSENIACGSDAPYGRIVWNYGGFRAMFDTLKDHQNHTDPRVVNNPGLFTEKVAQNYLGKNLSNLIIAAYEKIMEVHTEKSIN